MAESSGVRAAGVGNSWKSWARHFKVAHSLAFDVGLSRVFRFRETQSVEFRAEAYNVSNSFRAGASETNLSSANFGRIRNALDPRIPNSR